MSRKELGEVLADVVGTERSLQAEARRFLGSADWSERKERIRDALSNSALLAVNSRARPRLCKRAVGRCLQRVSRRLGGKTTAQRDLHRLRLVVKQARYLLEALGEASALPDNLPCKDLAADLRKLQNSLGDINDHFGLREWTLTAEIDATTRRALVREIDVRIDVRIARLRRLRKRLREPINACAIALLATAT